MKKHIIIALCILQIALANAQELAYVVSMPNAAHHEANIQLTVTHAPAMPLTFRMSRSSPGRYATHEFGKNVYNVTASNEKGETLACIKMDGDVYVVEKHNGTVTLNYTLFANHADGTYASVDPTGLHLNMPASFMWVKGMEQAPISIRFALPDSNWTVATQLHPTKDRYTFTAPNLQYFMDAPTKAGALRYRSWQQSTGNQAAQTIRIAFDTDASDAAIDAFTESVKKIVTEAGAVFGEYPKFDNGVYTFLASMHPWAQGDGMEHRNSTMISMPTRGDNIQFALGTFSHEFFHAWNVERIRPATLEPFNFEKSNMSDGLWLAEGFTQYYGELLELRSGLMQEKDFLQSMNSVINTKQNRPGGKYHSVIDNSQDAVFTDAGTAVDKTNFTNTFSSYYVTGAATALALDLTLRSQFNSSLDAYMQLLWQTHGKPEKPYSMADLEKALATLTKDASFAKQFFAQHVARTQPVDYASLVKAAGWQLQLKEPGKAWAGNQLREQEGKLLIASPTLRGTPLYEAGLDAGDEIINADGQAIKQMSQWQQLLQNKKPGDQILVQYRHRNRDMTTTLTLAENPEWQLSSNPDADAASKAFRMAWLGSKANK